MRINLPISNQEKLFASDKTLVSKTDTKGFITFANKDFVEICGYSEKELIGTNHNIIRHPDMPPMAFEVMWKTLKRGLPWRGIVKNRCKNGDHYWVDAKVVPIKKKGEIIGFMSVRTCPARQSIEAAQAAYQLASTVPSTIRESRVAAWQKHLSIKNGIPLWILFVTLMMIIGGLLGITGLRLSNSAIQSLYYEEMDPVQAIGRINFLMADNRAQVALAMHHDPQTHSAEQHDHPVSFHMQTLIKNKVEIDQLWEPYVKKISDPTEKSLAEQYWQARNQYVQEGLLKARQAIEEGDFRAAERILIDNVTPLYDKANAKVFVLLKHLSDRGRTKFAEVTERNQIISNVAIAGIVFGCLILVVAGMFFFRFTVMPLQRAVLALESIAEGNLSGEVEAGAYGEPGRVMAAVEVMQMHLKVMMHEIRQSADSVYSQCHSLNQIMMNLAEHSDEQHDRVYQTLDALNESCVEVTNMAENAELLMRAMSGGDTPAVTSSPPPQESPLEPMPSEFEAVFGQGVTTVQLSESDVSFSSDTSADEGVNRATQSQFGGLAQQITSATRVQSLAIAQVVRQLNQIADLIVSNSEDVQNAWAASQQLEKTARELDDLVKYFD